MQQKEFEELTGLQVTPEEYYEIEQIYNTVDTIDKKEFCEHWKRGNYMYLLAQLVKKVRDYEKWVDDNEKWAKEQSETKNACIPVLLDKADSYGGYKLCVDEKEFLLAMIADDEMTPSIDNTED
jgi:hypothetical protein